MEFEHQQSYQDLKPELVEISELMAKIEAAINMSVNGSSPAAALQEIRVLLTSEINQLAVSIGDRGSDQDLRIRSNIRNEVDLKISALELADLQLTEAQTHKNLVTIRVSDDS